MALPRKYINHLNMRTEAVGNERRYELLKDIMANGTFLPKTLEYKDIDAAFREWVEKELKISYNDKVFPTMVLYSNQRFTEYTQTWQYTDENKNLILNFKTVTRENNPQYGQIQGGLWNIPGNRFYLMKKQIVLDDNGSESILALKMRQPMAIDFAYKVSIFTTNLEPINDFNRIVNDKFKARQAYIFPNEYPVPMILENITDKSSYEIDDRQFYSQSYDIKVMGYVITEDDYRVEEQPLKIGAKFSAGTLIKSKADIDVEEYVNPCNEPDESGDTYFKPITITVKFPKCVKEATFDLDFNFVIDEIETRNIRSFQLKVDGEEASTSGGTRISDGSEVEIKINSLRINVESEVKLIGHAPDIAYSYEKDLPEIDKDETQYEEDIEIVVSDEKDTN